MTPKNQAEMEPSATDEEMLDNDIGMLHDHIEMGMADLNEEVQGSAEDMPEDSPGMMIEDPEMMAEDPGMMVEDPEMMAGDPGMGDVPELVEPHLDFPAGARLVPAPEGFIDPSTLGLHPLSEFMPLKTDPEYVALKESIEINGLQTQLTRFEGMILDGRHRRRASIELGIPVGVIDFVGSADEALIHVLSANQYHHDIDKSQRAAVAVLLVPEIAKMVACGRLEKVRAAWERKHDIGCSEKIRNNLETTESRTRTHAIAGAMMRVNFRYVEYAVRIQREAPKLFEKLHAGKVTLQAALRVLNGETDNVQQQEVKAARSEFNLVLRNLAQHPDFLKRFRSFLSEFTG